jgi:hypothetical protein
MITPLLEKYILSGQAVFKNTSIGENGLLALEIPRGSTIIITKIIIEPFLNIWEENNLLELNAYLSSQAISFPLLPPSLNNNLLKRCEYNLKVYSESGKVKINYNLRQEIEVNYLERKNQANVDHLYFPVLKPKYNTRELDCFILANETVFFMFAYPDWFLNTVIGQNDTFANTFNNTTPVPLSPNGPDNATNELYNYSLGGNVPEIYVPMGKNTTIETNTTPKTNEIFRGITANTSLFVPDRVGTPVAINEEMNYSLPLLNIEYVLINSGLGSLTNPGNEGI